jgi:periplasmic protein TonB
LDEAANSLQAISFQADQIDQKCRMALEEAQGLGGVMSDILRSTPAAPRIAAPDRVRVSSGVSQGLLLKKVTPLYPEAARQAGIQGHVVLGAVIGKNGDIESLTLISGDPALTDAATGAVRQWKYKPYLLQGQPVRVETQILVNFTLSY